MRNIEFNNLNTKVRVLHKYNRITGFYSFIGVSLKKSALPIIGFVVAIILFDIFILDIGDLLIRMTEVYPDVAVLSVFFTSESLLGLIPPEIFIGWSEKTESPLLMLTALAVLSYFGGIVSYGIGKLMLKSKSMQNVIQNRMQKHIINIRKWGGLLVIVGALLPIPFSMVSIAAGIVEFRFRNYLLFGSLRFVRFYLYAIAIFSIV